MKEQNKTPQKRTKQNGDRQSPVAEFKTLVIRMFNELRRWVEELTKNFNKEVWNIIIGEENIKKNQSEMMNTLTEMKNTLRVINSKVDEVKIQNSDLKDKKSESNQSEQQKK